MHLSKAFLLDEYAESSHEVPCLLFSCCISAYCKENFYVVNKLIIIDRKQLQQTLLNEAFSVSFNQVKLHIYNLLFH